MAEKNPDAAPTRNSWGKVSAVCPVTLCTLRLIDPFTVKRVTFSTQALAQAGEKPRQKMSGFPLPLFQTVPAARMSPPLLLLGVPALCPTCITDLTASNGTPAAERQTAPTNDAAASLSIPERQSRCSVPAHLKIDQDEG